MSSFLYISFIIFFLIINNINCITNDALKTIEGNIDENTIENEVNKIIKEYTEFNEKFEKLVEKQNKEKDNDNYDRFKYKEEYKKLFKEGEIFHEYFYKQRKRLSDFINKPTGKIPEQVLYAYNSILEYVLESKTLVEELGNKAFVDGTDL